MKNLESTSGPLSHFATPSIPPSIDTHTLDQQAGFRPKEVLRVAENHSYITTCLESQVSKEDKKKTGLQPPQITASHP